MSHEYWHGLAVSLPRASAKEKSVSKFIQGY